MATTTIPWGDGSGDNIYLTYPSASGNQTVQVSSDANTGAARSKVVNFAAGNISKQLTVSQEAAHVPVTEEITVVPSSHDTEHSEYRGWNNPTRGYNNTSNSNYSQINLTHGEGGETHVYYGFDFSAIPAGATINSVTVKVKSYISSTTSSIIASRGQNVCVGTTPKGGNTTVNTGVTTRTLDAGSGWTRADLDKLQVHLFAVRGSSSVTGTQYFRFYGAEVTVNYTY